MNNHALSPESQAISHNIKDTHTVGFHFSLQNEHRVPVKSAALLSQILSHCLSLIRELQPQS